jgi:hypothetical protein
MASAYHIFQNWKLAHTNQDTITSQSPSEMRSHLQSLTQQEVAKNMSNHPSNNKDSALTLSNRLIVQLYDQTPISP